jgi:hypothetical protein
MYLSIAARFRAQEQKIPNLISDSEGGFSLFSGVFRSAL